MRLWKVDYWIKSNPHFWENDRNFIMILRMASNKLFRAVNKENFSLGVFKAKKAIQRWMWTTHWPWMKIHWKVNVTKFSNNNFIRCVCMNKPTLEYQIFTENDLIIITELFNNKANWVFADTAGNQRKFILFCVASWH